MSDDRATPETGDEGFSLIDLIVAAGLMAVIMVIVTTSIILVYSNVNRTDGISTARDQIGNSFRRLDKEFRYATWVSTPGQVGGAWYLEYMVAYLPAPSPSPSPTATAAPTTKTKCEQLVFRNGVLTRAEWTLPSTTPGTPQTIATDLTLTGTTAPFTVYAPSTRPYASASPGVSGVGSTYELEHSQIRLRFSGRVGKVDLPLDVQFTAQNTNRNTPAANDCSKGRPGS